MFALPFSRRRDVHTQVLGWKELRALEDPKEDQGTAGTEGDGQRVEELREMGGARSYRAFPTILRNWKFKPLFQIKHHDHSNSPLKILSRNCL